MVLLSRLFLVELSNGSIFGFFVEGILSGILHTVTNPSCGTGSLEWDLPGLAACFDWGYPIVTFSVIMTGLDTGVDSSPKYNFLPSA